MKIRIKGNSVRYRLTKTDVKNFCLNGSIEEVCSFGTSALTYAVEQKNSEAASASYEQNKITVYLPQILVRDWDKNDRVGFNLDMQINDNEKLIIIVEKDFKCNDETTEDQSDNYENPSKVC